MLPEIEVLDPICGDVEAKCFCNLGPKHDGPHSCECGGSWERPDGPESFKAITFPTGAANPLTALFNTMERSWLW